MSFFNLEVEAAVNATVCLHCHTSVPSLEASVELWPWPCRDAVLDIDGHGLTELHSAYGFYGRDEVERDVAVLNHDILGMEVAAVKTVFIHLNTGLHLSFHLEALVYDERSAGLNQRRVMGEAL